MNPGDEYILLSDIYSMFKNGKERQLYAKKGTKVTVIWVSDPAVIVEGKEKFSVNKIQLEKV